MLRLFILSLALLAAACGTTTGGPSGANGGIGSVFQGQPRTVWDNQPQGRDWTATARAAIDQSPALAASIPKDIAAYCPSYAQAQPTDKRDFWVVVLSDIAFIESSFNPANVKTAPTAPGGPGDVRRGLFGISTDAARRYGCAATTATDLLDPAANITCAARILAQTSGVDGYVAGYNEGWRGASRYWLELRKPDGIAELQSRLNGQSFCPRRSS
jgi:hypothetical protein